MKTAAAYIRVSTEDQTEYSPEAQRKAIATWCRQHGYTLEEQYIFIDEGKSGRRAEKRPAFMKMIAQAKMAPSPFDTILVHRFDRFARSREDSVVYKSLLQKECGVRVISTTESIENDKMSLIMESMLEAMAEYYSVNLSEEVKKGMTEKASRGEPLSIAPFGYRIQDKKLIIIPEEADIVKKIFTDFIDGQPYLQIAKALNARGIQSHRGNKFENRSIEYILHNPVYCGYIRWNPLEHTKRNYDSPHLITAKGSHPPIISETMFHQAQQCAAERKALYGSNYKPRQKRSHWLVGLVRCPTCDGAVINNNGYFKCSHYLRGKCSTSNSIRSDILEQIVIDKIRQDIDACAAVSYHVIHDKDNKAHKQISALEDSLQFAYNKLERIKEAYQNGVDSLEEYQENKASIQNEIAVSQAKYKAKLLNYKESHTIIFRGMLATLESLLTSNADTDTKNKYARQIIQYISYNKEANNLALYYIVSSL